MSILYIERRKKEKRKKTSLFRIKMSPYHNNQLQVRYVQSKMFFFFDCCKFLFHHEAPIYYDNIL